MTLKEQEVFLWDLSASISTLAGELYAVAGDKKITRSKVKYLYDIAVEILKERNEVVAQIERERGEE